MLASTYSCYGKTDESVWSTTVFDILTRLLFLVDLLVKAWGVIGIALALKTYGVFPSKNLGFVPKSPGVARVLPVMAASMAASTPNLACTDPCGSYAGMLEPLNGRLFNDGLLFVADMTKEPEAVLYLIGLTSALLCFKLKSSKDGPT